MYLCMSTKVSLVIHNGDASSVCIVTKGLHVHTYVHTYVHSHCGRTREGDVTHHLDPVGRRKGGKKRKKKSDV